MSFSYVVSMPDLSKLNIPAKQRLIPVRDEQIFSDLKNQHRQIENQENGAAQGDYVLIDAVNTAGTSRTLHVELGGKCFREYGQVLSGCRAGQVLHAAVDGVSYTIQICSVRKVVELPLTDASIASLNIPGVASLVAYRSKYIREHGEEIADRLFRAIQPKLMDQVLTLAEIFLDDREMAIYHKQQCSMLENISGDVDERLMKAYGFGGTKTLEECYRQFQEDNKRTFSMYLWGRALAEQAHVTPTETEYRRAVEYYCLAFDKTEEQVSREGLAEEALRSFYLQYGIDRLRDHYKSMVAFSAVGITSQPLKSGILDTKVRR